MTISTPAERTLDATRLLTHLRDSARGPVSPDTLASELELDAEHRSQLQDLLNELVATGAVVETRGRFGAPERMNLVVGRLSAHPDGFAFVVPPAASGQVDLFIPGHQLRGALHGDRVIARFEHRRRSGKREGQVIRVLERSRSKIVAKFERRGELAYARPLDRRLGGEIVIPPDALGEASDGQIVNVEISEYPGKGRSAVGKVVEVLGDAADAKVDVEIVIREYDLRHEFPAEVLQEASGIATAVTEEEIERRKDFRALPIVTIDGENAQDFDDAVCVEEQPDGTYRLHIHIADVAHYVAPGSLVDVEARQRATSVYFPDRVLPMLPESLSNEICSLKPGVDRLVQSVILDIDRRGRTVNYEFHDGVIHSAARLTYRQVAAILDGDESAREEHQAHVEGLERMRDLAKILMDGRRHRGSIDFDLPEPELIINLRGETEDIVRAERNVAHRIIEEFMIRANEVVASHMTWEGVDGLYRVHEGPDETRIEALREFLTGLGYSFGGGRTPSPRHFSELLERLAGRPEERVVSMLVLRTMKRAQYQVENEGHFGLASDRYAHFTSPIRRYPDLVVHRVLKADRSTEESDDAAALPADLEDIASYCSGQERRAEEAEREYCGWKKVQFMSDKLGEVYEGHIVGVRAFGFFVELDHVLVEGMVPVSTLSDDYYRFDEAKHSLRAEHGSRVLALGDQVKVRVAKVDVERRRLDFALEEGPLAKVAPAPEKQARARGGRRRRRGRGKPEPIAADAPAQDPSERAADGSAAGAPAEGPKPRRRRGRRGGRRRRGTSPTAVDTAEGSAASAAPAEKASSNADTGNDKPAGGSGDSGRSSRRRGRGRGRSGAKESEGGARRARGASAADRGRGKGDEAAAKKTSSGSGNKGGRGRGRNDRRPGGRGRRTEGALPAPTRPEPTEPAATPKDDQATSLKVNPYLTDVDF